MGSDDAVSNAYLEHQRALNRERQKRYQARKRNVSNGMITDDNGRPHARLTRLAHNLANGMNDSQSLVDAGFSRFSREMLTKAKSGLADILKAKGLTVEKVVDSTIESLSATTPMLTADGCIERPDWSAKAAGRRDSIALLDRAGELPAASQSHAGTQITVNIVRFNNTQELVDTRDQFDIMGVMSNTETTSSSEPTEAINQDEQTQ